jgi:hypothetical protein
MISAEKLKTIDPKLTSIDEKQIENIRDSLYELGHLIFDDWLENEKSSKYPVKVLRGLQESNILKPWLTKDQKQE